VIKGDRKRVTPVWLASVWQERKQKTASCVEAAIEKLREANQPVTLSSIRNEVLLLFGRSLSTNTIKRNEGAYQLYLNNRRAPRTPQVKSHLILELWLGQSQRRRPRYKHGLRSCDDTQKMISSCVSCASRSRSLSRWMWQTGCERRSSWQTSHSNETNYD